MCNLYRIELAPDALVALARAMGQEVLFPEGVPNFQPRDVRITDRAAILRPAAGGGAGRAVALVERRWSWPSPGGKPVFNFRGEGRRFAFAERCAIVANGFYEFTASHDPHAQRKDRWLFTVPGVPWFGIAGIVRDHPAVGQAFTMLTCPPGPDVAPYHDRQVAVLTPEESFAWLDPASSAEDFVRGRPGGFLAVERA